LWHLGKAWAAFLSARYQADVDFATEAVEADAEFPTSMPRWQPRMAIWGMLPPLVGHVASSAN